MSISSLCVCVCVGGSGAYWQPASSWCDPWETARGLHRKLHRRALSWQVRRKPLTAAYTLVCGVMDWMFASVFLVSPHTLSHRACWPWKVQPPPVYWLHCDSWGPAFAAVIFLLSLSPGGLTSAVWSWRTQVTVSISRSSLRLLLWL